MIIDHLGGGVHQGDRALGVTGQKEKKKGGGGEKRRRRRKIVTDVRADQSKIVQEVLADLKKHNMKGIVNADCELARTKKA